MTHAKRRLMPLRFGKLSRPSADGDAWLLPPGRRVARRLRPIGQLLLVLPWTLLAGLAQALLLMLPGQGKVRLPRLYWAAMSGIIGLQVRVIGRAARRTADGRPVVFVSNHSSWLDILVLGGRLDACFTAKEQVGTWPLISTVARLGRTVFIRRTRTSTARERDEMRARLAAGDNLILFPEGTTSDGARVLPFRSAFLSIAELPVTPQGLPPIVQPISVVYDRLAGLPTGRAARPIFAWYGDMDIASHYWQLAQHGGMRATVLLHTPLDPRGFADRKALSQAIRTVVADGAALLRQNRPARPITIGGTDAALAAEPALA